MGIIDGDNFTLEKIQSLQTKGVQVLPFNEIEMLLLSDEVLTYTMKAIYPMDYEAKIDAFKAEFYDLVLRQRNKIALINTTEQVNEFIAKEKIQEAGSIEAIQDNMKRISEYDVQEIYNKKIQQIEETVEKKNYKQLLILCNLKKEISKGLANKFLDGDYETKAVQQIQTNVELQNIVGKNYFDNI